mmetsp:Transcript_2929/g.4258  ORF Transcript_2929/g.4258 Transcript_2929/m.4258 type:complete len:340 (-) Transcript_2929:5-1024(-)
MDERILCNTFQYIGNLYDLARCRQVCHYWMDIIDDELELQGLLGDSEGFHHQLVDEYLLEINRFVSRHRETLETLHSIPCHDYILQFSFPKLTSLTITPNVQSVDIRFLPTAPLQYLDLSLNHSIWNLNKIPEKYPLLKALVLEGCVFERAPWVCNVLFMIKEKLPDLVLYVGCSSLVVRSVFDTMLNHLIDTFGNDKIVTQVCSNDVSVFQSFAYHHIGKGGDEAAWEIMDLVPSLPYTATFDDQCIPYTNSFLEAQLVQHVSADLMKHFQRVFSFDWNRHHNLFKTALERGNVGVISYLLSSMDPDILRHDLRHIQDHINHLSPMTQHAILMVTQSH